MATLRATVRQQPNDAQPRWALVLIRAQAKGWSQNKLAKKLRTERGHLSRVIRGARPSGQLLPKAERLVSA